MLSSNHRYPILIYVVFQKYVIQDETAKFSKSCKYVILVDSKIFHISQLSSCKLITHHAEENCHGGISGQTSGFSFEQFLDNLHIFANNHFVLDTHFLQQSAQFTLEGTWATEKHRISSLRVDHKSFRIWISFQYYFIQTFHVNSLFLALLHSFLANSIASTRITSSIARKRIMLLSFKELHYI